MQKISPQIKGEKDTDILTINNANHLLNSDFSNFILRILKYFIHCQHLNLISKIAGIGIWIKPLVDFFNDTLIFLLFLYYFTFKIGIEWIYNISFRHITWISIYTYIAIFTKTSKPKILKNTPTELVQIKTKSKNLPLKQNENT